MSESPLPDQSPEVPPTVEQTLPDLGPYVPPRDFDHGDEFDPAPPRPLPPYVRHGSYSRRQRGILYTLAALGIAFIVFWPLPFVQELSYYILPLAWLHWIGLGLIGIAAVKFFWSFVDPGRYRYIREGIPFVGRVQTVGRIAGGTKEYPQFKFVAPVEFDHPETGQHQQVTFEAEDYWPVSQAQRHTCTLEPGEYVTLVGLPGKLDTTAKVYGFLGLDPEREFLLKDNRPLRGTSPFTAIMIAFAISVGVLILMGLFDLVMFSFPVGGAGWMLPVSLTIGGAIAGAALGLILRLVGRASGSVEKSGPGGVMLCGGFLGAIAAPLLLFILNSQLDPSGPNLKPIEIVNYWENTTNLVVRDYEIEYRDLAGGPTEKKHIRHSQIRKLGDATQAVIDIGSGRFGYNWIRGFYPVSWMQVDDAADVQGPVFQLSVDLQQADVGTGRVSMLVAPVIEVANGELAPVPPVLMDNAVTRLKMSFPDVKPLKQEPDDIADESPAAATPAAEAEEAAAPTDATDP